MSRLYKKKKTIIVVILEFCIVFSTNLIKEYFSWCTIFGILTWNDYVSILKAIIEIKIPVIQIKYNNFKYFTYDFILNEY